MTGGYSGCSGSVGIILFMPSPLIEFLSLYKSYQEGHRRHVVFEDVNAVIGEGEFVVLLGKSGTGKSTLLNLVSGIDAPDRGDIHVNSASLVNMNEDERTLFRRHNIGFVFQSYNLIPTLTVTDNLLLPLELIGTAHADGPARAGELLEELGVMDRADCFPDQLSGGEQQRVAIARALIHRPAIILADEPTGNLDQDTGQEVLTLLDRLVKQAGRTLIMVTHSREVVGLADRLLTIRDHRLQELEQLP